MQPSSASADIPPSDSPITRVTIEHRDGVALARFGQAKVDGLAVRELFEAAMKLTDQAHPRLVVDLSGILMATSGLMGILVQLHKRLIQAGGRLAIVIPDQRVRGAFEIANLHTLLYLCMDIQAAWQGVKN